VLPSDKSLVARNTQTNKDSETKDLDGEKAALQKYVSAYPEVTNIISRADSFFLKLDNIFNNYEDVVEKYPLAKTKIDKFMLLTTSYQKKVEKSLDELASVMKKFKQDTDNKQGSWTSTSSYQEVSQMLSVLKTKRDNA